MQPTIITSRLNLNIVTEADYDFMMAIVNSKGWLEFIGDRNVHCKEDAIAYIKRILTTANLNYWVVTIKETNLPIGIISFIKRTYLDHFDIGFAFLPQFNGYGYAYEAAKEVLLIATQYPQYDTISATTLPKNVKSITLLNKLGLQFYKAIKVDTDTLHVYSNTVTE